jgi:hypothetical protein
MRRFGSVLGAFCAAAMLAAAPAASSQDEDFKAPDLVSLTNAVPGGSPKSPISQAKAAPATFSPPPAPVSARGPLPAALEAAGFKDGIVPVGANISNTVEADGTVNIVVSMPDGSTRVIRQGPATGQQTFVLRAN